MCLFEIITTLKCPLCGICRSLAAIFQLNLLDSLFYNILTIPIIIFLLNEFYFKIIEINPYIVLYILILFSIVRNLDNYPFY